MSTLRQIQASKHSALHGETQPSGVIPAWEGTGNQTPQGPPRPQNQLPFFCWEDQQPLKSTQSWWLNSTLQHPLGQGIQHLPSWGIQGRLNTQWVSKGNPTGTQGKSYLLGKPNSDTAFKTWKFQQFQSSIMGRKRFLTLCGSRHQEKPISLAQEPQRCTQGIASGWETHLPWSPALGILQELPHKTRNDPAHPSRGTHVPWDCTERPGKPTCG